MTAATKGPGALGCVVARHGQGRSAKGSPHLFKATASETSGRFDFMTGAFAPLTGPPLHLHREQHDTFYILDGLLTLQVGDEVFDVGPGDFISIPPGVAHTFDNLHNGNAHVTAINLMTPGGLFEMFDAMAGAGPGREQRDAAWRVAEAYGTAIVGPPLRVRLGLE